VKSFISTNNNNERQSYHISFEHGQIKKKKSLRSQHLGRPDSTPYAQQATLKTFKHKTHTHQKSRERAKIQARSLVSLIDI
jgi:hypothetical protein